MLKKVIGLFCCLLALGGLNACSSKKVIPQGKRIAVLAPVSTVKPDVSNGQAKINIPAMQTNSQWLQTDFNAYHVTPNLQVSPKFEKQWSASFGEGASKREVLMSTPLVAEGKVYTLDVEGLLSAFNLKNGESVWYTELKPQNKYAKDNSMNGIGIAYDNGIIFATTGYGDVFAVNAKKGDVVWTKSLNYPLRTAPMIAEGKVFVQSADNKFFALDEKDGEILWKYDIMLENTTLVGGSVPAYCKDLDMIIAGFSSGELQTFNASIGSPLWSDVLISNRQAYSSTFLNTIKASPVVEGETVYAFSNGNVLTSIDARTGLRNWEKEIGGKTTPLLAGNVLYVISNDRDLLAINKENGNILWAKPLDFGEKPVDVVASAPIMLSNRLIIALSNGNVFTYDPKNGTILSSVNLDYELNSSPIAADGYIIFVTSKAKLLVYK